MNHGGHPQSPGSNHDIENLPVRQLHRIIGHVQLDTSDTHLLDHSWQFLIDNALSRIRQYQMKRVIAETSPLCQLVIRLDDRQNTIILLMLCRNGNHRRVPSTHRAPRPRLPGVARRSIPLLQVDMRIDPSRRDIASLRINDLG